MSGLIRVAGRCECPEFVESLQLLNILNYGMNGPEPHLIFNALCTDPEWPGVSAYVVPSVTWALWATRKSGGNFEHAMMRCAEGGGDVDTTMAMCGAIMGARVGRRKLPKALVAKVQDQGRHGSKQLAVLANKIRSLGAR